MVFSRKNLVAVCRSLSRLILAAVVKRHIYLPVLFLGLILVAVSPTSGWAHSSSFVNFKPENFYSIIGVLVPGMIILFVRSQFVTGRLNPPHPILSYLAVSGVYYALVLLAVNPVPYLQGPGQGKRLGWFLLVFVLPVILGLLLGYDAQKQFLYRFFRWVGRRIGLNPVHGMPSAWDRKFGNMNEQWVLVTLNDGTRFGGFLGEDSFMSSDPNERDIYIQWIYDIDKNNNWSSRGDNGILIAADKIRTMEFWPYEPEETK